MGKLKFTLSNILFWPSLLASCLVLENVGFLSSDPKGGLPNSQFFLLFALAMVGYLAYFVIDHIYNHSTLDFFLVALLGIGFGAGLVTIWSFSPIFVPSSTPGNDFYYHIDTWNKIRQTLSLLAFIVTIYGLLFFVNKNFPSVRKMKIVFIGILIFSYVSALYSLITEWDIYVYNLSKVPTEPKWVYSFYWNPNMFSSMLLMGAASSIGLNIYKKNFVSYFSLLFLTIMIVLIGSLAAIMIVTAATLFYFLLEIGFLLHQRKMIGILWLAIYLLVIVFFIVLYACGLRYDMGVFTHMCTYLHKGLRAADYGTLTNRLTIWRLSIDYIGSDPLHLMFGYGFNNSNIVIAGLMHAGAHGHLESLSAHSGYIQILMNFGVVGCALYFAFLVYFVYSFFRLLKTDTRFALLYLVIGSIFVAYSVMESIGFFIPNSQGILIGATFFLPMINQWKHRKHPQLGDDCLEVERPKVMEPDLLTKSVAKIIMSLIAMVAALFIFPLFLEYEEGKYLLVNIIVVLILCLFTLPMIISSQAIRRSRGAFIANMIINLVLIFGVFGLVIYNYLGNAIYAVPDAKWVYPVLLGIVLIGETIIFSVAKRRRFKDYLKILVGMSKNSFMGLVGAGVIILITYFVQEDMEMYSPMTLMVYPIMCLYFYYVFALFVPFKDTRAIVNHYNSLAIYSLKKQVLKDRLGYFNERRKD